ncbi:flavodoxin domain-containing protein [Marinobacterium marinum]|uniref:Flavodoxin domain-containing protein n=1 Tax=Marinobacterium marinum TaxID=2756129 RepID=A0A7W1WZN8_9GAMM|nr:flavodoxin domain-containing protein [Marinobacterium marinum]MBA4503078.1 flavodoxin domain-containing protein [Marinobacterium marinum]
MKNLGLLTALAVLSVWQLDSLTLERRWLASGALVAYALVLMSALRRVQAGRASAEGGRDYWIAYATETGTARQLAQETRKRLRKAGYRADTLALNALATVEPPDRALLLVVSTTGDGDAPKTGIGWDDERVSACYAGLDFAVLALGDRGYPRFCAFGLEVTQRMQAAGARPLFAPVQVSQADPRMIDVWFRQLLPEQG